MQLWTTIHQQRTLCTQSLMMTSLAQSQLTPQPSGVSSVILTSHHGWRDQVTDKDELRRRSVLSADVR